MNDELAFDKGMIIPSILLMVLLFSLLASVVWAQASLKGLPNGEEPSACRAGMRVYQSDRGQQLLGEVIEADFPRLLPGWNEELKAYKPAAEDIQSLRTIKNDIDIICVLGTWCHDSEREVPRFWKILQETENPHLELTMFALGRSSDEEARAILDNIGFDISLRETYGIELVPTFIFLKDGVELGRIIESPKTTLEEDAVHILLADAIEQSGVKPAWN